MSNSDRLEFVVGIKDDYSAGIAKISERTEDATGRMKASFEELGSAQEKAASGVKKLEERYRKLGLGGAASSLLAGTGGIARGFSEHLMKGMTDMDADYSALADGFIKAMNETASKAREVIASGAGVAWTGTEREAFGRGTEGGGAPGGVPETGTGAQEMIEQRKAHLDKLGSIDDYYRQEQVSQDELFWNSKLGIAGSAAGQMANLMQNLYAFSGRKNREMFETMKAFAVAETVIQTYRAAQGAYAALAKLNPALGIAAAATAVAAGMARVRLISQTKPAGATGTVSAGGTANPSYSGGSLSAYPVPQRIEGEGPKQMQQVTVHIYNPLSEQNWQKIAEENIIPALRDARDRNIEVSVINM